MRIKYSILLGLFAFAVVVILSRSIANNDEKLVNPTSAIDEEKARVPQSPFVPLPADCGPRVLKKAFDELGVESSVDELKKLSGTIQGRTSLLGLKRAVQSKGLQAEGMQISLEDLKKIIPDHKIVAHVRGNDHFILLRSIENEEVEFYDPSTGKEGYGKYPVDVFLRDWEHIVLVMGEKLKLEEILGQTGNERAGP